MKSITFIKIEDLNGKQVLEVKMSFGKEFEFMSFSIDYDFNNKQELEVNLKAAIEREIIPEIDSRSHTSSFMFVKFLFSDQNQVNTNVKFNRLSSNKVKALGFERFKLRLALSEEEARFIFQCFKPYVLNY
jgi:hypothetical protein